MSESVERVERESEESRESGSIENSLPKGVASVLVA